MMEIAPLDVVLAGIRVGECIDPRYAIVISCTPDTDAYYVLPCSAQLDLYRAGKDFMIPRDHPDFPATGLSKTTYVIDCAIQRIGRSFIRKKYGRMQGELADKFGEWLG